MRARGLENILIPANGVDYGRNKYSQNASKWETIKDELCDLGLTVNEVEIYIFLARYGIRKASEISRLLNIPKTETYVTLSNLKNRNIVMEISERPVRFDALPFEKAFKMLINEKRKEIESSESSLESLLDMWRSLPPRATGRARTQQFQKLRGLHRIYYKLREMTEKTRKELIIMASSNNVTQLVTCGLLHDIASIVDNGVDVTIITEPACETMAGFEDINVFECSSVMWPLPFIILLDREEMLAITDEDSDSKETTAFWTNCSTLCEAVHLFFTYEYSH